MDRKHTTRLTSFGVRESFTVLYYSSGLSFLNYNTMRQIIYNGYTYWYEQRPGKDRDICLATTNPDSYCNGFYAYSSKDPGSGMVYVVVRTNHPNPDWSEPPFKSN